MQIHIWTVVKQAVSGDGFSQSMNIMMESITAVQLFKSDRYNRFKNGQKSSKIITKRYIVFKKFQILCQHFQQKIFNTYLLRRFEMTVKNANHLLLILPVIQSNIKSNTHYSLIRCYLTADYSVFIHMLERNNCRP